MLGLLLFFLLNALDRFMALRCCHAPASLVNSGSMAKCFFLRSEAKVGVGVDVAKFLRKVVDFWIEGAFGINLLTDDFDVFCFGN